MVSISRLAVLEHGEPAVRILAAIGNLSRRSDSDLTAVLVHDGAATDPWFAREADEVLSVATSDAATLVAALVKAGIDAVWPAAWDGIDVADLAHKCEAAGLVFVGPSSAVLRRITDPAVLATTVAGTPNFAMTPANADLRGVRRVDVDVLGDAHGTMWAFPPVETTVSTGGALVLAESPAAFLDGEREDALREVARGLLSSFGYVGAGVVTFLIRSNEDEIWIDHVDPLARPTHALAEESTGASFVSLRLLVAQGSTLDPEPPHADGWSVEVRLLASGEAGALKMLSLPTGTGVRADASRRVGDLVDPAHDMVIAVLSAWGRDRAEAMARLRRSVERTVVVLERGEHNRSDLLTLLDHPDLHAGPLTGGWYDDVIGQAQPAISPLAIVAAAVEAYEADLEVVLTNFFASARHGRPANPEAVGSQVHLSSGETAHSFRVDRIGPNTYRVHDGTTIEVVVNRLGEFERRLISGGRKHAVIANTRGAEFLIDVDGQVHIVRRVDGVPVRSPMPALVSRVLVKPGDRLTLGDPVVMLESMKMVSTLTAPFDGEVVGVDVVANAQVEAGAPLFRLRQSHSGSQVLTDTAIDFASLAAAPNAAVSISDVYARLTNFLLGYDLDPAGLRELTTLQRNLATSTPGDDPALRAHEDAFVDLFAEIGALYRPRTEAEVGDSEVTGTNTQEYFLAFLQWLDADRAGLPERYRTRLLEALARYSVPSLAHTDELEHAMLWLFRSFSRIPAAAPFVRAILERRLLHADVLRENDRSQTHLRLDRLAAAMQGRQQQLADLARDVVFDYFEKPVLDAANAGVREEMAGHLKALSANPQRFDRSDRVDRLVWCPHPLRRLLLDAWRGAETSPDPDAFRQAISEAYLRRFYRIRQLRGLDQSGQQLTFADYEHEGKRVHVVTTYSPLADLANVAEAIAAHLADEPADRLCVVDLVTWTPDTLGTPDEISAQMMDLLRGLNFGRPLHRLDLTVAHSPEPGPERTLHLTYRQLEDSEFTEELLYRNLHPMLGKRLDLWRLSNFNLERLASPDDVYLFLGVAKENPRDRRLFALAEVRDLGAVVDEETGERTYVGLGRMGLEALAAMRAALSKYSPRERPAANRLVLAVRPVWDIPADDWHNLAVSYESLAKGAGLDKVVLHVLLPRPDGDLEPQVVFLDGIGKGLLSISLGAPGPNAVRPLTPYAQKVLTAERFGVPYPYEIVRMLTPGESSTFPKGSFVELDLDEDGETLIEVDRPAGQNSAHIVVGLITNITDVVPEGMTRVALLSDPTQGLGNLAEPECRRINAALALAAERNIPVEWYAVSSGALIAMDSGTENMDWIALTLRRIIEHTQAGHEINIVVTGINVGGQPYWNAEATMLLHTKGILVMTPASQMVLTGKQALDFSGAVSADDNSGIGGYDRIMGPNGQGQYWAPSFSEAVATLLQHYDYAYVVPGERFPRKRPTTDPAIRDICESPHTQVRGSDFTTVGEVFSPDTNPDRKQPFDMRSVMRAVADTDCEPLERWRHWVDADTTIVWDATIGGTPVCMLGIESHTVARKGFVPSYGPPAWTSGTLFPQASRKAARAINACTGNRPLVVLANLSGFDGSPESMRNWQLEYGAEIGRAITNFDGPIVFVVVSRYHGGAFVVFSKALTESMEIAAVAGSFASVIGGAPAAATVFARETKTRTEKDPRVVAAREALDGASGTEAGRLRAELARISAQVRSEKLGEVSEEFDDIHTIDRARQVGSVDHIIEPADVRSYIIDALDRGMARFA